jgi:hypothetical protein
MTARHVTEKEMQQTKGESAKEKRQVRSKKKHQIRAILGKRNGPISAVKRGKFDSAKAAKFRRQVVWGCKTLSLVPRFRAFIHRAERKQFTTAVIRAFIVTITYSV